MYKLNILFLYTEIGTYFCNLTWSKKHIKDDAILYSIIYISLLGSLTFSVTAQEPPLPGTLHRLYLADGEIRTGYVIGNKEDFIRIQLYDRPNSQKPTIIVLIKRSLIQSVVPLDWNIWPSIIEQQNCEVLEKGWNAMNCLLGIRDARVGFLGNAFAKTLLYKWKLDAPNSVVQLHLSVLETKDLLQRAQSLYEHVEQNSHFPTERAVARLGRLKIAQLQGKHLEVINEASAWIGETPDCFPEVWMVLGESLLSKAETLSAEHPRWQQDPFILPEIISLFHQCLNASLVPFIRYPNHRNIAASSLAICARVYTLWNDRKSAEQAASDLAIIYPEFQSIPFRSQESKQSLSPGL